MKKYLFILIIILWGCNREIESPQEELREIEFKITNLSTGQLSNDVSHLRLLLFNKDSSYNSNYIAFDRAGTENNFELYLPIGEYIGVFVANAKGSSSIEYAKTNKLYSNTYVLLDKKNPINDYMLGKVDLNIAENNNTYDFMMKRKVCKFILKLKKIPIWVTNINLKFSGFPTKLDLKDKYSSNYSFNVDATATDENKISTTNLYLYPPKNNSGKLTITYQIGGVKYEREVVISEVIIPNKVILLETEFSEATESFDVGFSYNIEDMSKDTIKGRLPNINVFPPCDGDTYGDNLAINSGFETVNIIGDSTVMNGWKTDGGSDFKITSADGYGRSNSKAAKLSGKGNIYQDIIVSPNKCYELSFYANSTSAKNKFKYELLWYSEDSSSEIHKVTSDNYINSTNGYEDIFDKLRFRTPVNATTLRILIKTYTSTPRTEIYLDDLSIYKIK